MYYKFINTDGTAPRATGHDFTVHIKSGRFRSVKGELQPQDENEVSNA